MLLDGRTPHGAGNILRLMFHPDGLRPFVQNWEAVAQALVRRVHREALGGTLDDAGQKLLSEGLDYPGVPKRLRTPDLGTPLVPVVPVSFGHRGQTFNFFSAVTVLGTAQDITLQELRVECFFPMDEATGAAVGRYSMRPNALPSRKRARGGGVFGVCAAEAGSLDWLAQADTAVPESDGTGSARRAGIGGTLAIPRGTGVAHSRLTHLASTARPLP